MCGKEKKKKKAAALANLSSLLDSELSQVMPRHSEPFSAFSFIRGNSQMYPRCSRCAESWWKILIHHPLLPHSLSSTGLRAFLSPLLQFDQAGERFFRAEIPLCSSPWLQSPLKK